jgi:hypothetical protein
MGPMAATTQVHKKVRNGRKGSVTTDAGIAAAKLRRAGAQRTMPPAMVSTIPIGSMTTSPIATRDEALLRLEALESAFARQSARLAVLEQTLQHLHAHNEWPEWAGASASAEAPDPETPDEPMPEPTPEPTPEPEPEPTPDPEPTEAEPEIVATAE